MGKKLRTQPLPNLSIDNNEMQQRRLAAQQKKAEVLRALGKKNQERVRAVGTEAFRELKRAFDSGTGFDEKNALPLKTEQMPLALLREVNHNKKPKLPSSQWIAAFNQLQKKAAKIKGVAEPELTFESIPDSLQAVAMDRGKLQSLRDEELSRIKWTIRTESSHKVKYPNAFMQYREQSRFALGYLNALLLMHNIEPVDIFGRKLNILGKLREQRKK